MPAGGLPGVATLPGFRFIYDGLCSGELLQYVQAKGLSVAHPPPNRTGLGCRRRPALWTCRTKSTFIHARGFLRHLRASFPETEVPPPGILAPVIRPKPYLYTAQEMASLLQATHPVANRALCRNSLPTLSSACSPAPVCELENPSAWRSMMSAWMQFRRIWRSAIPSSTSRDWCRSIPPRWSSFAATCWSVIVSAYPSPRILSSCPAADGLCRTRCCGGFSRR